MGSEIGDIAKMGGFEDGVWHRQVGLGTKIGEIEFGKGDGERGK